MVEGCEAKEHLSITHGRKMAIITGGSGFIAGHLAERLMSDGWSVTAVDRFVPKAETFGAIFDNDRFDFVKADISDGAQFTDLAKDAKMIFHLAANSDTRGAADVNFRDTLLTTKSVLDAMVKNGIRRLFFSSSSAVYGERPDVVLTEDAGGLKPVSYYGASKLASESLIHAYSNMNSISSLIFRFPNVVGPRMTHGVIFDFIRKLKCDPKKLEILGNGMQKKQYIHVRDLINGICMLVNKDLKSTEIYNISTESSTSVDEIARIVCDRMGLKNVMFEYTGGPVGWKGDVRSFALDISKIKRAGWTYRYNSTDAVTETIKNLEL